jgi:hypothetical protein
MSGEQSPSGIQIGNPGTLELSDHVFQHQLSLLETLEHDLVHVRIVDEPGDHLIEVLMLYAQLL